MKDFSLAFILLNSFLLSTCINKPFIDKQENNVPIEDSNEYYLSLFPDTLNIFSFENEQLKFPILCQQDKLILKLGEPDTIVKNRVVYVHSKKERIYIDQLNYWNLGIIYSSYNDKVRLQSIDLKTSKARLLHEKIVLDENTSLNNIKKLYPRSFSCKSKYPIEGLFCDSIIQSEKLLFKDVWRIPFLSSESLETFIILYFIDNKLRIIEIDGFFDL